MRVNYTITPNLSVQVYAAPFVSAGDYDRFKHLVERPRRALRGPLRADVVRRQPDFNYRSFRTTNVLRWEYKPGSALFVVWQQGRERRARRGTLPFGPDFRGVFGAPRATRFLVKWSYWINSSFASGSPPEAGADYDRSSEADHARSVVASAFRRKVPPLDEPLLNA
jgi:hypothetical protein